MHYNVVSPKIDIKQTDYIKINQSVYQFGNRGMTPQILNNYNYNYSILNNKYSYQ